MAASREASAIAKKFLDQRNAFWPNTESNLWNRTAHKGFATIPKTMPLVLQVMDDLSNGKPLSSTYLGLWCATWDNSFVTISKPQEMAHAAGFGGQRAEYTWGSRMKLLQELGFIDIKPGKAGAISYVIIWNPHYVIRWHRQQKTPGLLEGTYNALLDRAVEVGAKDMLEDLPTATHAATPTDIPQPEPTVTPPAPAPAPESAPEPVRRRRRVAA